MKFIIVDVKKTSEMKVVDESVALNPHHLAYVEADGDKTLVTMHDV